MTNADPPPPPLGYLVYQFFVGVYGGYFGAGIGILMLAVLGAMGLTNIHQMERLEYLGALVINAVAAGAFRGERHRALAHRHRDGGRGTSRRLRRRRAGSTGAADLGAACHYVRGTDGVRVVAGAPLT